MGSADAQTNNVHVTSDGYLNGNSVEAFFADSVILITGATGFVGKALLEKLLRSCPRIAMIFIIIRPKRGQLVEQRFKTLLENSVFDRLKQETPDALKKIYPMKGDVASPNLGLSVEDRETLVQRVNIVFHSAATVRFNETLKSAVNMNVRGTERVIELCKSIKNLVSVVHVSTAYCNATQEEIKELIYTTKVKPVTLMDMCDNLDDDIIKIIEQKILEDHPNTYTFTKKVAEQLILMTASDLPIAIVRPSIIGAAQKEPFPGWVDSLIGLTGVVVEVARGTARSLVCVPHYSADLVPVDHVVNTLICVPWHTKMQLSNNTVKIYHCTSTNPVSWSTLTEYVKKTAIKSPLKYVMWYPGVMLTPSKFIFGFMSTMVHTIPALLVDLITKLQGNKPIMMKTVKRISHAVNILEYFATHQWKFHKDNMNDLTKKLESSRNSDHFGTNMKNLEWDKYMELYFLGIKKFILREQPENQSNARSRLWKLYWIHRISQIISIVVVLKMVKRYGR